MNSENQCGEYIEECDMYDNNVNDKYNMKDSRRLDNFISTYGYLIKNPHKMKTSEHAIVSQFSEKKNTLAEMLNIKRCSKSAGKINIGT